ncbi:MAG: AAA family ATPase [Pseudoruegeria sp.]
MDTIDSKEVKWLWEPFIPFSMITIMEGDPGVGKSFLAMQLAVQVSIGGELGPSHTDVFKHTAPATSVIHRREPLAKSY